MTELPLATGQQQPITEEHADVFVPEFYRLASQKFVDVGFVHVNRTGEDELVFSGDPFRFAWNGFRFYNSITKGMLRIVEYNNRFYLHYKLAHNELFLIALVFTLIPISQAMANPQVAGALFALIWIFLYLGPKAIARTYFKKFLLKTTDMAYKKATTGQGTYRKHAVKQ